MRTEQTGSTLTVTTEHLRVVVALRGTCANCPSAEFTLAGYAEKKLREFVDPALVIEETKP